MADEVPRRHREPVSEESLDTLYDLVPASEEIDLAEQAALDRIAAQIRAHDEALRAAASDVAPDDGVFDAAQTDTAEQTGDLERPERLTEGQVRGMLEHILGAQPIRDHDPEE